jgi:hypothetical protein
LAGWTYPSEVTPRNGMAPLQAAQAFKQFLAPAASVDGVVSVKAPFGGPKQVRVFWDATRTGW